MSNFDPSLTAFFIPKGIEIKYTNKVVHSPSEIETGNFSKISDITLLSL